MLSSRLKTIFLQQASNQARTKSKDLVSRDASKLRAKKFSSLSVPTNRRKKSLQLQNITPNKVNGIILDWSGTTVDKYVMAPAVAFVEAFKKFDVSISIEEARSPMGLRKDLHIEKLTEMDSVKEKWKDAHGEYPNKNDVEKIFEQLVPIQLTCLKDYSKLLPGVAKVTQNMQEDGILIGVSTGFTRKMVDILLRSAKDQGFNPDATVAGDEVNNGSRPAPHMLFKNMDILGLSNPKSIIKADDTTYGIGEGLNAGCWTVGFSKWSNYVNVDSFEHEEKLTDAELRGRRLVSRETLLNSGAHYVIDDITSLPSVIADVNRRLKNGESPSDEISGLNRAETPFKSAPKKAEIYDFTC